MTAQRKPDPRVVAGALLRQFRRDARSLPWRRSLDPYAIWISEVMLQQTQVAAVIPYFERWMTALPNVRRLAASSEHQVLDLWAGLGYYTRPRRLLDAARIIVRERDGRLPDSIEGWLALPGIGRYTAGAICSIAFNQPTPIVDGNVNRVLSRLHGFRGPVDRPRHRNRVWRLADDLVHHADALPATRGRRNCSDLNQALMELGATICTPRKPNCARCPLRRMCVARRRGRPTAYPRPSPRSPGLRQRLFVLLLERRGRYFVRRASTKGWNAGLWEFPTVSDPGCRWLRGRRLFDLTHTITRHHFRVRVLHAGARKQQDLVPGRGRWLTPADLDDWPLSGLHRKIARRLALAASP
jgi:A/G-specific adenine glycosylase